jgi:hypothetical protein
MTPVRMSSWVRVNRDTWVNMDRITLVDRAANGNLRLYGTNEDEPFVFDARDALAVLEYLERQGPPPPLSPYQIVLRGEGKEGGDD